MSHTNFPNTAKKLSQERGEIRSSNVSGFTVRAGLSPSWFEVALATDPELFWEAKARRNHTNFYSSRAVGPLPAARGDAVYLVPPAVLARFAGQPKLYYVVAAYRQADFRNPEVIRLPRAAIPSIQISKSFTSNLRDLTGVPNPAGSLTGNGNGYVHGNPATLEWGGDTAAPGEVVAVTTPTNGARRNGTGSTNDAPQPVATQSGVAIAYDDGFDPQLWSRSPDAGADDEHYGIEAPNNDVAWHARSANGDSIGIEHVANTRGLNPSEIQYCASAALVHWLAEQYNGLDHRIGHSLPLGRAHGSSWRSEGAKGIARRHPGSQQMIESQFRLHLIQSLVTPSKTTWHADSTAQVFVSASLLRTPRLPVSSCVPSKRFLHGWKEGISHEVNGLAARTSQTMRDSTHGRSGHTRGQAFLMTRLFYGVPSGDRQPDDLFDGLDFVSEECNGLNTDNRGTVRPRHLRRFPKGLWQMIEENGRSRVYLGVHWVFDAFAVKEDHTPDLARQVDGKFIGGVPLGLQIAEDIFQFGDQKAPMKSTVGPQP